MTTTRKETGIARVRRLMREQRCMICEQQNPDYTIRNSKGKHEHYHVRCP